MKVTVDLQVSDKEFYSTLNDSLVEDIFNCTGKKIQPIAGLEFPKTLSRYSSKKPISSICRVENLQENKIYAVSLTTGVETTSVLFDIEQIDRKHINVTYEETTRSNSGKRVGINHQIVSTVLGFIFIKRKMKKRLRTIESYIVSKR